MIDELSKGYERISTRSKTSITYSSSGMARNSNNLFAYHKELTQVISYNLSLDQSLSKDLFLKGVTFVTV